MANTVISPNMNMPVPVVGVDPGPDWATNLDSCLSIIDQHNHTPGRGVQITTAGLNINTDLPLNGNNLITARSVRLAPQLSPIGLPADLGCIYESAGDLWYNSGGGAQVRLTNGSSPAGGAGSITGLPSGTASASYSAGTFTFQSATNTPATMNVGPVIIGQPVASGFGVTISPSVSQAANYNLTLPVALPTTQSYVISDASGNLSFLYNGANVRASEAGGTTTLTSADNFWQVFNLSAARTVLLPSGGITKGQRFTMENVGTGTLTVQSSGANTVGFVDSLYSKMTLVALVDSPSTAANWKVTFEYSLFNYIHGGSYNGAGAPTVTLNGGGGSLIAVKQGDFMPYQLNDGTWRMRFNIMCTLSSTGRTTAQLAVAGITNYNNTGDGQSISGTLNASVPFINAIAENNTNLFTILYSTSSTITEVWTSGDIRLNSKPTWAF